MALPLYDPGGTQRTERQQANSPSPDAFGAGVGRGVAALGNQMAGLGAKLAEIDAKNKLQDDKAAVISAEAEASGRVRKALYDEGGIYSRTGENAAGMTELTQSTTEQIGKDISSRLTDPVQKQAFDAMWAGRTDAVLNQAATIEFKQREATRTAAKTASLANLSDDVTANYRDPKMVAFNINEARKIIRANPDGLPDELIVQMERESVSALHTQVINRLAQDNPGEALDYYEKNKGQVHGKDHATVNAWISGVQNVRAASDAVEQITGSGAGAAIIRSVMTAEHHGLDPTDLEVAGRVSSAGAAGATQVMPDTAREVAVSLGMKNVAGMTNAELEAHWKTPQGNEDNIKIGGEYLSKMLTRYDGDLEAALVAYNAGPGNGDKWLNGGRDYSKLPKPGETLPYVQRVFTAYKGQEITGATSDEIQRSLKGGGPTAYYSGDAGTFLKTVLQKQHGAEHIDGMLPAMQDRLAALFNAAPPEVRDGLDILSGKRSTERQKELWEASDKTGKWVARPGNSRHEHGDASDLGWKGGKFVTAPPAVKEWVHANAEKFGLRFPLTHEPWHIETVEARKGGTPKGKASKPNKADVAASKGRFGPDGPVNVAVPGGDPGTVELAPDAPGNPADVYTRLSTPFNVDVSSGNNADAWLAEARTRYKDDPAMLAEVERQLGDIAVTRKAGADKIADDLRAEVVKSIINGGKVRDLYPMQIQALDRAGKLDGLLTLESKWTRQDGDTDPATYVRLSKMSADELKDYDITADVDKLSPADFKKFADRQGEFMRAGTSAVKRATDQSRTQILTSAENILALDPTGSPDDALRLAALNRAVDDKITAYIAANGKEPDGPEMQAMVDSLLMEGTIETAWSRDPKKRVFELLPGEASRFIDAADVTEIPEAAKPLISKGYRGVFGAPITPGDEQGALQFYNDMVRVQLGGSPVPPKSVDARIRQGLVKVLGRTPTPEEMATAYREMISRSLAKD